MTTDPLALAHALIAAGIPVVVCTPARGWQPGSKSADVMPPEGWNTITADACDLSTFRAGVDTLAMVAGHGIDVVDIDAKPPFSASPDDLPAFDYFGVHRTPSGGWHYFVPSTGYAKLSPFIVDGKEVGDYAGGTVPGGGRLLVYLPGSTRPKYPDTGYSVEHPVNVAACTSARPDAPLLALLDAAHARRDTLPGAKATTSAEVAAFLAEHEHHHGCHYGRKAVPELLAAAGTAATAKGGRHGWAVRTCTRLVELMRGGCASRQDYDDLAATLDRVKPEGGTDIDDVMRWALGNATGESGCTMDAQRADTARTLTEWLDTPTALDTPAPDDDGDDAASTWQPVDLAAVLDGTYEPEHATLMPRSDGVGLLYPGRLHSFHGESESGKSLVAQAECARTLTVGGRVLYVDFESDHGTVVGRLLALGASPADVRARFDYVRPDAGLRSPRDRDAFHELLSQSYALAVVDGVTEALALLAGSDGTPEDRIAGYVSALPRRIARRTGAAVVQVDHVTKSTESRGRFALGSQHKMNALDGAAYTVEVVEPLGLGLRGVVVLRIAKDRPGTVRPSCGAWRKTDRTQEAARIVLDATTPGRTRVTVEPPATRVGSDPAESSAFRPTLLMERVSLHLEAQSEAVSERSITDRVTGKSGALRAALDLLVAEGHVTRTTGPRGAHLHTIARAYRQVLDPHSDRYDGGDALDPEIDDLDPVTATASASPPKKGDAGRSQTRSADRVSGRSGTQTGRSGTQSESDLWNASPDHPGIPIHACAGAACATAGCEAAS